MPTAPVDYRISQMQLSAMLGVSRVTLRDWTKRGYVPKPQRVSRNLLYSLRGVLAAIKDNQLRIDPPRPLPEV